MESAATTTAIATATAPLKAVLLRASPRSRPRNSFIDAGTQQRLRLCLTALLQHPGGTHRIVRQACRHAVHCESVIRAIELDHISRTAMHGHIRRYLQSGGAGRPDGL